MEEGGWSVKLAIETIEFRDEIDISVNMIANLHVKLVMGMITG